VARQTMGRPAAGAVAEGGRRRDPRVAAALSVVPGLGQLYNLQPAKAVFFLLSTILTIGPAVLLITAGERLGTELLHRGAGTAFLLLALGSVIVFLALLLLGLAFWASAVVDARRSAIEITERRLGSGRWWFFRL
jgi:TM2 domain-containing membrane protein YozV